MAKKAVAVTKTLNAPKKITWTIALIAAIIGIVLWIVGLCKVDVLTIVGPILLIVSSALMLLSSYVKGL